MLHTALLSVLRIFFDNFHSEFSVQEQAGNLEKRDVDENAEIFQFDIPAVYQLQPTWISRYEHVNAHSNTHAQSKSWMNRTFNHFFSYDSFSISCELLYGAAKICDVAVSENISTSLSLRNKIRCNRK